MARGGVRDHLSSPNWPAPVYAIGDIHGCLAELQALERHIIENAGDIAGEKLLVCLGDYVDRGPNAAGVLDHVIAPPPDGFQRICLMGNHEAMMLDFIANPVPTSNWLLFGGVETLASYGIDLSDTPQRQWRELLLGRIPAEHLNFLRDLPLSLSLPGTVFVHAGLRSAAPVAEQSERDLLWIRDEFYDAPPVEGRLVVHGHTPGRAAIILAHRICVDTGAFASGRLTAVRLAPNQTPQIIDTIEN